MCKRAQYEHFRLRLSSQLDQSALFILFMHRKQQSLANFVGALAERAAIGAEDGSSAPTLAAVMLECAQ
jgi:hypothetical protein